MILLSPPQTLEISVEGDGLLRFVKGGALVYVRRAKLHAASGVLVDEAGSPLAPKTYVSGAFSIGLDGTISCSGKSAGRIVLARVAGGKATLMNPGEGLAGVIRSGFSNARPATKTSNGTVAKAAPKAPIGPSQSNRISIVVHADSPLDGERILLGSIADIEAPAGWKSKLATLDLGKLPPLGVHRTIGVSYVRSVVRGTGLKADAFELTIPTGATAFRSGVVIETQAILDQALQGNEGLVPSRTVTPMTVPRGELELSASTPSRSSIGTTVVVTAKVDGKLIGTRTVSLVPDPNVPKVRVGDPIRLRLISGGAAIELPAKVKSLGSQGGRQGSEITVVTSTGSVHTGQLLSNGLLEVRL